MIDLALDYEPEFDTLEEMEAFVDDGSWDIPDTAGGAEYEIEMPPKLVPVFTAEGVRYRWAWGGRGSGKTQNFAEMLCVRGYLFAEAGVRGHLLCGRELMNSLEDSSLEEIKSVIRSTPWLNDYYEIGERFVRTKNRRVSFIFAGLRHNLDSIKSKARVLIAWVDEAEGVSDIAWKKLNPTVRAEGVFPDGTPWNSEIWVTWNPENEGSATDVRFRQNPPDNGVGVELNHYDNPWFPAVLEAERLRDQKNYDDDEYAWVWEGAYRAISDAQIFKGKFKAMDFEPDPKAWDGPYFGMDFGFAEDPTTVNKIWIAPNKQGGRDLYLEYEANQVGLELDKTATFVKDAVPTVEQHVIRADNARPESISYLKRHGLPRIIAVKKGKGSVEDGIAFMKSFDRIFVHTRCTNTLTEFRKYSYKVDRNTEDILPIIVDKWNHHMDAIRYGLEPAMKRRGMKINPKVLKQLRS